MIPLLPLLIPSAVYGHGGHPVPSLLDNPNRLFTSAGRMALVIGLRLSAIGRGDEVLLPAYGSPSLAAAVVHVGAVPVFYRLRPDLRADTSDILARLTPRTRALLAVNTFGFSQDWTALRALADAHGLILIEDCAHALYGTGTARPLGFSGDFAIASLPKLLPAWDGGALTVNRPMPGQAAFPVMRRRGLRTEAKAVYNLVEDAVAAGRLRVLAPLLALAERMKPRPPSSSTPPAADSLRRDNTGEIDPALVLAAPAWISRLVAARAARPRLAGARRRNFAHLAEALAGLPGCEVPFHPAPGEVPSMVPVRFTGAETVHRRLLARRIPMQRYGETPWPGLDRALCPVSDGFARELIQFPCHQDLRPAEIDRLAEEIRAAVRGVGQ